MCFGVQNADGKALRACIGGDVGHAQHGQGEVIGSWPLLVITQWRVDEDGVSGLPQCESEHRMRLAAHAVLQTPALTPSRWTGLLSRYSPTPGQTLRRSLATGCRCP